MPKKNEGTETKTTPEQTQQAAAQVLQEYFSKDVNDRINELSDEEMVDTLRRLEDSEYWIPMLRYINKRLLVAQSVINQIDPVQQPTSISRTQGIMSGLTDLQNVVIMLVQTEKNAETEAARIRQEYTP